MAIKVIVVDDNATMRYGLNALFAAVSDIDVVGCCRDGCEVAGAAAQARPDVVLMDMRMPVDGLTASRRLLAVQPSARVVFLSGTLTRHEVRAAWALGAVGYLLKDDDPAELPDHIRAVAAGGTAWSPKATAALGSRR